MGRCCMVGWVCGGDNIVLLLLLRWIRGGIGEIVSLSLRTRVYRDAATMMMLVREMGVAQRRDTEEQGDASVESEKKATQVWWYEGDTKSVSSWFSFRCYLKKDWIYRTAGAEDVLRLWRSDTRSVAEMQCNNDEERKASAMLS